MSVHESYELASLQDRIIISAKRSYTNQGEKTELLDISRPDGEITVRNDIAPLIGIDRYITQCYGVFGIIRLIIGSYIIVITERDLVGEMNEHKIWHIKKCEILPIFKAYRGQNQRQSEHNSRYLSMIHHVLSYSGFYYSSTYDITRTTQKIYNSKTIFDGQPLFNRADTRFVWNHHLMKRLLEVDAARKFCIPIMLGFISIKNCEVNGHFFKHVIISRRSSQRVGVRYYTRGLDEDGNAANYVETEQIMVMGHNIIHSFCQSRGSVPLIWSQDPNLKYKPKPVISDAHKHSESFIKHFESQINYYNSQYVVNLLDNKGREKILSQGFKDQIDYTGLDIKYTHFDFHKECSKLRWYNLSKLMDILQNYESEIGYFSVQSNDVITQQNGIFRTNCIDCLDRTNVVQSMLARRSLQQSLRSIGILRNDEQLASKFSFETIFRNTWADNADMLAEQYTGTRALKTDYTRTGKRGIAGLLKDGLNSCIRYVYNNFQDGFRQDALDLFVGNYQPRFGEGLNELCPFDTKFTYKQILAPIVLLCLTSLTFITLLIPTTNTSLQMAYLLMWGLGVAVSSIYIINNGKHFVNKPTLMQRHT